MPPRLFVTGVVVCWLAAMGWLVVERWLPWWKPEERPPFAYDLADEVAPEHASWKLYRQGQRAGSAETVMAPHKDGTFQLTTRLRDLDVSRGAATIKMPIFTATRNVNRSGDLLTLEAKAVMEVRGLGLDLRIDVSLHGRVEGDEFLGECEFESAGEKWHELLEPIRLVSKNAFSPLLPQHKFPPLRSGQTWRVANIDPVSDALSGAMRQVIGKKLGVSFPGTRQPKELLARVLPQTEVITVGDNTYTCRVIEYLADRVESKTWVDVEDGKVIKQEASGIGETLVLVRE